MAHQPKHTQAGENALLRESIAKLLGIDGPRAAQVVTNDGNGNVTVKLLTPDPCCSCDDPKHHRIKRTSGEHICKFWVRGEMLAESQGFKPLDRRGKNYTVSPTDLCPLPDKFI